MSRFSDALARSLPDPVLSRLLAVQYRLMEPELGQLRHLVPAGRVAVDVGAWRGPWTEALAPLVPTVHSFEVHPELAANLRRIAPSNVVVHEVAASDQPGTATFYMVDPRAKGAEGRSSLERHAVVGREPEAREVPTARLDDLDLGDVGFIKIDVEGHEGSVIRGALGLIKAHQPLVLAEIEQRAHEEPIAEVWAPLLDLGYRGWFLRSGRWCPLSELDVARDQTNQVAALERSRNMVELMVRVRRYIHNFLFTPANHPGPASVG